MKIGSKIHHSKLGEVKIIGFNNKNILVEKTEKYDDRGYYGPWTSQYWLKPTPVAFWDYNTKGY